MSPSHLTLPSKIQAVALLQLMVRGPPTQARLSVAYFYPLLPRDRLCEHNM